MLELKHQPGSLSARRQPIAATGRRGALSRNRCVLRRTGQ
jgi:hypothetical protein